MARYYCYLPTKAGSEPKSLNRKTVFSARNIHIARKLVLENYGMSARLFKFKNFFDRSTFKEMHLI